MRQAVHVGNILCQLREMVSALLLRDWCSLPNAVHVGLDGILARRGMLCVVLSYRAKEDTYRETFDKNMYQTMHL